MIRNYDEAPDNPKRHRRLLECKTFSEIEAELRRPDCPVKKIAQHLLDNDPAFRGLTLDGVVKALQRYRNDLTLREVQDGVKRAAIEEEIVGRIDEIRELEWLVLKQRMRIQKLIAIEEQTGRLVPQASSEIEQARRLAEALIEAKRKLGIYETVPEKLAVLQKSELTLREDTQDVSRNLAERLRRMGWSDERIAALLGITPNRVARVLELHRLQ